MSLEAIGELARSGRLYPAVILHGGDGEGRREAAVALARTLLCGAAASERPCGDCRHCRRIGWPEERSSRFHPDFQVLERDLRTSTSVDATRELLRAAQVTPFEAAGQVFVVASAETLTPEAANALLKSLEEPHRGAPRHFLLLAPSQFDLLPTLRSRSLAVYLGGGSGPGEEEVAGLAEAFGAALAAWRRSESRAALLAAASTLEGAGGWKDPRAGRPWELAAAAVVEVGRGAEIDADLRRRLLALAGELLTGPDLRVRGIPPLRILEGFVDRHLGRPGAATPRPALRR